MASTVCKEGMAQVLIEKGKGVFLKAQTDGAKNGLSICMAVCIARIYGFCHTDVMFVFSTRNVTTLKVGVGTSILCDVGLTTCGFSLICREPCRVCHRPSTRT